MQIRFLVPLLLLPVLAQAQMYRWIDDNGKVHYSDRIPVSGAKNVQKKSMPAEQGPSATLPYALQQAVKNFPVTLYASGDCGTACVQARELLNRRGVPYSEVNVADESDLAQLKKLSGGSVVPVMTVGHQVYTGFEKGSYNLALDTAGYPASSLLPPGVEARKPAAKPVQKSAVQKPAPVQTDGRPATPPQETAGNTAETK